MGTISKRDNFGRAMYDMFGIGRDVSDQPEKTPEADPAELTPSRDEIVREPVDDFMVEKAVPVQSYNATYLAAGTMMKGTLSTKGDVEIAGDFEGEIIAKGRVTLHSNINSKITATGLVLVDCELTGDVEVTGDVALNEQSVVHGNVRAENMTCSGRIKGDLDIQENLVLDGSAEIDGNIKVDTLSVARGAKISGNIEMRNAKR